MNPIDGQIVVRDATGDDAEQIRDIYVAIYGDDYAHPQYYDLQLLKRLVYAHDNILLVAEDTTCQRIVGTASVLLDVGAYGDLAGEFARLAVHPDARGRGIGNMLMVQRLARVTERLHVGLVDNRVAHPFSQRIAISHGFLPVGFLPKKLMLAHRESLCLFVRHFGDSLKLRRNNPHIVPEAHALAEIALANCGLEPDAIVDDISAPYPHHDGYDLEELSTQGYAALLRFERGRVSHREILGPVRLHYGLFKLKAKRSRYLLARERGRIAGGVGFTLDRVEKAVRIFELVSRSEQPIRFLLDQLIRKCIDPWGVEYVEVDVSAFAPRMQRTLVELGFLPAAYVPAMAFQDVERLDAVKMVRLLVPFEDEPQNLVDEAGPIAELILDNFASRNVLPRVARAAESVSLFARLNQEQIQRLASACRVETFQSGDQVIVEGHEDGKLHIILKGQLDITVGQAGTPVGKIGVGECVGEMSLLCGSPHSATATAQSPMETAVLSREDLRRVVRQRPDIGMVFYRNMAEGLGKKLWRSDQKWVDGQ